MVPPTPPQQKASALKSGNFLCRWPSLSSKLNAENSPRPSLRWCWCHSDSLKSVSEVKWPCPGQQKRPWKNLSWFILKAFFWSAFEVTKGPKGLKNGISMLCYRGLKRHQAKLVFIKTWNHPKYFEKVKKRKKFTQETSSLFWYTQTYEYFWFLHKKSFKSNLKSHINLQIKIREMKFRE